MARRKKNSVFSRFRRKNSEEQQPSILQTEKEKRWDWRQIAFAFVVVYCSVSFMNGCYSIVDLKAQQNEVLSQTQEAQAEQKTLRQQADYLETKEAVEKSAREDLQMVKPGEILLTRKENAAAQDGSESSDTASDGSGESVAKQ